MSAVSLHVYVRYICVCVCPQCVLVRVCVSAVCVFECERARACAVNVKSHRSFPDFKTDILVPDARGFSCELPL